ncbi:MAG: hypothetical protein KJ017_12115 [Alphaproteobacteria bacterium]|nr:hypothetical protein [Alphaproteobacteria bacterium]
MTRTSMANQYMSLSLFLMLLSFFIIMNGTSGFEESKARPVMRSLSVAFSNTTTEQGEAPLSEFVPHSFTGEGETLERIESLFNSHLPDAQAKRNRLGNMMRIRLPVRSFEIGIDTTEATATGSEKGKFLPMLVALLQSQSAGIPYRMDMMMALPDDPAALAASNPSALREKLTSVSTMAQSLERAGIPGTLMGTGLERGENGFIDIYFRRDEPYEPPPGDSQDEGAPL